MNRDAESKERERRRIERRLEWGPVVLLALLYFAGLPVVVVGLASLSFAAVTVGFLLLIGVTWFIEFWILLYAVVEYLHWRRTRNVGHRLQYLGASLFLVANYYPQIAIALGGTA